MENDIVRMLFLRRQRQKKRWKIKTISGSPPLTYKAAAGALKDYRIYGNTVDGESVGDLETTGEHAGEYKVPVTVSNGTDTLTTPIYLPEQIRKVGDEAEYIDYAEQKQHRVRKNLFDEKYENIPEKLPIYEPIYVGDGYFTLSTTAPLNANSAANLFIMSGDVQTGASTATTGVWSGHKGTVESVNGYITVAYRYQYGVDPRNYNTMLNAGSTALPYEPYIENTEVDVTLPSISTLAGTNVLTVGTAVQPSGVDITGRIKKGE
jgi:hypothetical protein